ncbi:TetR/AcrR family transcriptional regulator C-terminal domain-containing protein [Amycolatopsis magusensis]|uniref:DNA-binding transcriptional regulator YhcF (GntR family) n=1 Tax=Amycolatopsis magusensis TaxID=882444 RepID=A0ABS4PMR7_9PSEU|nr:TetR/AcrR family transcriptional regulator C-terminal domain-containing protein [Amycolatopsis magusensis]MBP2180711.1 DNA-binding transcriptional regulator YhcF (GntR family) [Amycolatopsis magusensis]MDI5980164.1 TetR/AcrR family transcriptional regulator C-terminal domain-containing protein [Amycolatopsis magusensis]
MNSAPYARIVDEIRQRIESGTLKPGDRVPSTRQITQDWGVAMATATKVLTTLRREGLVRAVPGVGTVVRTTEVPAPPVRATRRRMAEAELSREAVIRKGIEIADAEGLRALSMRRVATDLGAATMSLYRYVPGKDELVLLMANACFGEELLPAEGPEGWRARFELAARTQWRIYRRHPWLAQVISMTRPQPLENLLLHAEWAMSALRELDLPYTTALYFHVTVFGYVRGAAANLEPEVEAERETGLSADEYMETQNAEFNRIVASGAIPHFSAISELVDFELDLDLLFELGLRWTLDGMAGSLARHDYPT